MGPSNAPAKIVPIESRMATRVLTMMALCIGINYVGGTIALWLRLPVYLDSIGTIFAGALLGPIPGMKIHNGQPMFVRDLFLEFLQQ